MTLSLFATLIERYGAILDRWPPHLIDPALDLLGASDEAQDCFAAATSRMLEEEGEDFGLSSSARASSATSHAYN